MKEKKILAQMYDFSCWVSDTDSDRLHELMPKLLQQSGFTVLNMLSQDFPVQGFTAVWILAESHLAIHTFPEEGKTYIQISSCNAEKLRIFKKELQAQFL